MPSDETGFKFVFRALSHRNYRLFFGGQSISLIGTWMQQIAISWLTWRLTHSAFLLGFVGFAGRIPTFFLASFAGVLADRWNRHHMLVVSQILSMVQAAILAVLVLTDRIAVWHIVSLSILLGLINAFDIPARQTFVLDMLEKKEDLPNAIALNSSMVNGARLVGPSLAGTLIAVTGEGICFLLNAVSFIPVVLSLLLMRLPVRERKRKDVSILKGLAGGYRYAFGFFPIRSVLLLLALVSLMGMPYVVLMPIIASNVLHGGPQTLGFLSGASGIGALTGAVYLASRRRAAGLGRLIVLASVLFGIGLIGFSLSRAVWLSLLTMVITGFGMMVNMTSSNTVLQTISDEDKRGRVMSFYTMAFMGMVPFGSLLAGALASRIGAPETILCGGVLCIIGSLLFARHLPDMRKLARPI